MLEPIGQNVIVEIVTELDRLKDDLKKRSGLLIGDTVKQGEPNKGRVYAISPVIEKHDYEVGDLVIFHKKDIFDGFHYDGKDLVAVLHEEILGKLTEGDA